MSDKKTYLILRRMTPNILPGLGLREILVALAALALGVLLFVGLGIPQKTFYGDADAEWRMERTQELEKCWQAYRYVELSAKSGNESATAQAENIKGTYLRGLTDDEIYALAAQAKEEGVAGIDRTEISSLVPEQTEQQENAVPMTFRLAALFLPPIVVIFLFWAPQGGSVISELRQVSSNRKRQRLYVYESWWDKC